MKFSFEEIRSAMRHTGMNADERAIALKYLVDSLADGIVDRAMGAVVREARQELGMKQHELGSRCDLSGSMISMVELGKASLSYANLFPLAEALNISVADLVQATEDARAKVRNMYDAIAAEEEMGVGSDA